MSGAPLRQTPSQTVGPFFHDGLVRAGGNVLAEEWTRGERIRLTGRVLDGDAEPVTDALVEIWQADAAGIYAHPADPRADAADPHFRGFGRADSSDAGRYTFETVKPGARDSADGDARPPFIDMLVFARGLLVHAFTRVYFSDERNESDPLLERIEPDRRHTLIARREDVPGRTVYHFDVVLQGDDETVFIDP